MQTPKPRPQIDAAPGLASPFGAAMAENDRATMAMVREAIRTRRLALAYQPIVLARDVNRVAFHEGLMRVLDPSGRVIPARDFMPAIENTELGRDIDVAALDMGLTALAANPSLRLAVNMSARSIGYAPWMESLARHLAHAPLIGERLILEITESSAMTVPDIVVNFMETLQARGVAFALDDFGAGQTSLRYFRDFFFDIIKIDAQFIRSIDRDRDNQALAAALISIGKHFDMFTVAEAVETVAEAEWLQQSGVDCLQGFLFGAPTLKPAWAQSERKGA